MNTTRNRFAGKVCILGLAAVSITACDQSSFPATENKQAGSSPSQTAAAGRGTQVPTSLQGIQSDTITISDNAKVSKIGKLIFRLGDLPGRLGGHLSGYTVGGVQADEVLAVSERGMHPETGEMHYTWGELGRGVVHISQNDRAEFLSKTRSGTNEIVIIRSFSAEQAESANKNHLKVGVAYLRSNGGDFKYVRDVDLKLSDSRLAQQFLPDSKQFLPESKSRPPPDIHQAVGDGNIATVTQIIETEPSLLEKPNVYGMTPLHIAAREGKGNVVTLLLSKGAELDKKYNNDGTALHLAALNGQAEVVIILLSKGANPKIKNAKGMTSLDLAVQRGKTNVINLFHEKGL